jgi:6-phosphofructokinase 1
MRAAQPLALQTLPVPMSRSPRPGLCDTAEAIPELDGQPAAPLDGYDLTVKKLGSCRRDSPLAELLYLRHSSHHWVDASDRVLLDDTAAMARARGVAFEELPGFEAGGPRRKIFFDPSKTRVGIVTCGGLCPGLNNVIRGLVMELTRHYGVHRIVGFRNGYQGFIARYGHAVLELTPELVRDINEDGGTILGSSRGGQDPEEIVDCLEQLGLNILIVIGGDGSLHGAQTIAEIVAERELRIAVVGVPKTIDNDIPFIDHSFGFRTAFSQATESIRAAHIEARSAPGGVGLVKLMGRHSGFIACYAALAKNDADYVLIPEVRFELDGEDGLLAHLRRMVETRGHAVIVVAEGAGQDLFPPEPAGTDASGNVRLRDIAALLQERIGADFARHGREVNLKLLDPSYVIRSVAANPYDSVYCVRLAHAAVHAAMAGRTETVVGRFRGRFVHIPIPVAISGRSTVDPDGDLWLSVLESTGQPARLGAKASSG